VVPVWRGNVLREPYKAVQGKEAEMNDRESQRNLGLKSKNSTLRR
jgi:hypothetical protein